jgi:hypothetical protein
MKCFLLFPAVAFLVSSSAISATPDTDSLKENYGPAAALHFAQSFRGEVFTPNTLHCYPDAVGVPFADCEHITPMTAVLWTPTQIVADFHRRMKNLPATERKKGIIVLLKTERCATKSLRACTVTTAALEKRSTPLVGDFALYGLLLKPRDNDVPAGSLAIETGLDAWKNQAAKEYDFKQGPGATITFLDPENAAIMKRTDAIALQLFEKEFLKNQGATPKLHQQLEEILAQLEKI